MAIAIVVITIGTSIMSLTIIIIIHDFVSNTISSDF